MEEPTIADLRNTFFDLQKPIAISVKHEPKQPTAVQMCPRCFRLEQKRAARMAKKNHQYHAKIEYRDVLIDWK